MSMRIHRFIAQAGITSRRKAEEMIAEGRVTLNGHLVTEMGVKVEEGDKVKVDGRLIKPLEHCTLIMNKPRGVLTTMDDPGGRKTVLDLVPDNLRHAKPVGRLDKETDGLLLLTTDGELASRLTHAKYGVEKEYVAVVEGRIEEGDLEKLRKGVFVEGRRTSPAVVRAGFYDDKHDQTGITLIIHEGRKRQVRMMCLAVGHPVKTLRRVRIGHLVLKGMAPGEVRRLPKKDLDRLKASVGLGPEVEG